MATPTAPESISPEFLENHVSGELATQGVALAGRGLRLKVERLDDKWLVSLIDLASGQAAASLMLDGLPADREAAVAAMTRVAADLAAQVAGRTVTPPGDDRTEREQRGRAELAFQRQSIHFRYFGRHYGWIPLQGDLDHVLGTEQFLITVGRPDLVGQYTHLRPAGFAIIGVSAATLVAASIALVKHLDTPDCSSDLGNFEGFSMCVANNANNSSLTSNAPMLALGGASIVGIIVGLVYASPQVLDDNAARDLADAYNQHLRRQLGLPTATATNQPWLHDVKLAPYVARSDAGLALRARF